MRNPHYLNTTTQSPTISFPATCSGYCAVAMTALAAYDNSKGGKKKNHKHPPILLGMYTCSGLELFKKYQCAYLSSFSWSWTLSGGGSYRTKAPSSRGSWRARRTPAFFRPNAREPRGPRNQQSICELTRYNQARQQAQLKCPSFMYLSESPWPSFPELLQTTCASI